VGDAHARRFTSPREIEIFLSLFYHYFDAPVGY
jgi:hypothetical protein